MTRKMLELAAKACGYEIHAEQQLLPKWAERLHLSFRFIRAAGAGSSI